MSAPQLALLEVAMSRMERVHAWVLMMGGGGALNVFEVRCPAAAAQAKCTNLTDSNAWLCGCTKLWLQHFSSQFAAN